MYNFILPDLKLSANFNVQSSFVPEAHVLVGRPLVFWAMKQDEFRQEIQLTIAPLYLSTIRWT